MPVEAKLSVDDDQSEGISSDEYVAKFVDQMMHALASHWILVHVQNRHVGIIEIGHPNGSSNHRCEIILVNRSGHLVLTGDHDTMCWGRYSGEKVAGAVAWISRSKLSGYVIEKASIGMGSVGCTEFQREVALHEAYGYLKDAEAEASDAVASMTQEEHLAALDDDGDESTERRLWYDVIRMLREGAEQPEIIEAIYDFDGDCERAGALGEVPSVRLMAAWTIVRKANELLLEAEAEKEGINDGTH